MRYIVALTGGIGSGKSTVANAFANLGINVIDADIIARQVVEPGAPALHAIADHFGANMIAADGTLQRRALRERIFANPEEKNWLNALLHPLIQQETQHQIQQATSPYVLWVVPLLVENSLYKKANRVLVVDVSPETQLKRTMQRDDVTREHVEQILAAQATREARLAVAVCLTGKTVMQTQVLFEHPLNEKMRTWLRIEFLIQQLTVNLPIVDHAGALHFFRNVSELLDVFERGEVRTELLKELDRQQRKLQTWIGVPGVDQSRIEALIQQLKAAGSVLISAPRIGQFLREDRLIALVRQRLSIPGGCCSFDLPTLHIWLHLPQAQRDSQVETWIASLNPLTQALTMVLDLIRQSAPFRKQTSLNGFYQDNGGDADLLRLNLSLDSQLYPQISGHKSRFAIRFMPLDSENGQVPERLDFELACC